MDYGNSELVFDGDIEAQLEDVSADSIEVHLFAEPAVDKFKRKPRKAGFANVTTRRSIEDLIEKRRLRAEHGEGVDY